MSKQHQFTLGNGDLHDLNKAGSTFSSDNEQNDLPHKARGDVVNGEDVGSEKVQHSLEKSKTDGFAELERDSKLVRQVRQTPLIEEANELCR